MIPDNGNLDERKKTTFCIFLLLIMFSCHLSREGEAINLKTTHPNLKKRVLLENTIKCKLIYETMGKVAKISKGRDQQFGGVLINYAVFSIGCFRIQFRGELLFFILFFSPLPIS